MEWPELIQSIVRLTNRVWVIKTSNCIPGSPDCISRPEYICHRRSKAYQSINPGSQWEKQLSDVHDVKQQLSPHQQRLMDCATEKGASAWITALPTDDLGFLLHKGDFRAALCLCYGWSISWLPPKCCCGSILCWPCHDMHATRRLPKHLTRDSGCLNRPPS